MSVNARIKRLEEVIMKTHTQRKKLPISFYDVPEGDRQKILEDIKKGRDYANRNGINLGEISAEEFEDVIIRAQKGI
jgi:hypothetical protein